MLRWPQLIRIIAVVAGITAGSLAYGNPQTVALDDPDGLIQLDAQPFAAAVKEMLQPDGVVRIDPRPIVVHHDSIFPDTTHYLAADLSTVEDREAVLRDLGVETGETFPLREGCSGYLVPPPYKVTSGCPVQSETEYVFGLPKPGGKPGEQVLPLIGVHYSAAGRGVTTYDAILIRCEGAWVVDRIIARIEWD